MGTRQKANTQQSKKYSRLQISSSVLNKWFRPLNSGAPNKAYTTIASGYADVVFMRYKEDGGDYFTMLDKNDYQAIKDIFWEGFNKYIVKKCNHREYLHRVICGGILTGMIVHHRGNRFDNRGGMFQIVTPEQHDQHRTYCGDLIITDR